MTCTFRSERSPADAQRRRGRWRPGRGYRVPARVRQARLGRDEPEGGRPAHPGRSALLPAPLRPPDPRGGRRAETTASRRGPVPAAAPGSARRFSDEDVYGGGTAAHGTPLRDVVRSLGEHHVDGLPVTDAQDRVIGVVLTSDLADTRPRAVGPGGTPGPWWVRPVSRMPGVRRARTAGDVMTAPAVPGSARRYRHARRPAAGRAAHRRRHRARGVQGRPRDDAPAAAAGARRGGRGRRGAPHRTAGAAQRRRHGGAGGESYPGT
ncbi:CBS domain-containing protein [Streptomyces werraensis]|uniref:CBS domain-containing protein n=1 Tax=Streptomyces werraensis TaxID=68284 RepID=UPI003447A8A3